MSVAQIYETMEYGPASEDAEYVKDWLQEKEQFPHYINGEFVSSIDGLKPFSSYNPATGEKIASLSHAGKRDVDAAVHAAKTSFPAWSKLSGYERAKYVYALARLIQKNSRFLAVLETIDNGKPIRESRDIDIPLAARHFYHHAGWAQLQEREFPDHSPLGVVGQIIPWNFPFLMLAWKIAPAIAMGNCVVLKPAEYTSLTALYFAELCQEAGLPAGVINIVTGTGDTGSLIANHDDITKIAFTGSTDVGRILRKASAGSGKKLSLELGGKSPFIIFEDADLDGAVEGLVDAIWFNQGQVCCAGSRLLVEESVAEKVYEKIKRRLSSFRIGDPLDKTVDMGAIVDPVQKKNIEACVDRARSEGADIWVAEASLPKQGCFYPPTLIHANGPSNSAMQEEIFGPVLSAMSFRTLKEAISLANNSRYGLAATIWSESINRALEVSAAMKSGIVWINTTNAFDAACGFGGVRESGFGREGGREGIYEYLKPKKEWDQSSPLIEAFAGDELSQPAVRGEIIDQTPKNYLGGKQKRPDWGRTMTLFDSKHKLIGRVGIGNRKDIRDAVEAAFKADSWGATTGHHRAQILYFLGENLSYRREEFAGRLRSTTGVTKAKSVAEVDASVSRLFAYGAWADKYDGLAHSSPQRNVVLAVNEPVGIIGAVCPDSNPLLSFLSILAPIIAMGNRGVIVPSTSFPLLATDFYQVLETSDVPGGVVNIVTGERDVLAKTLAEHDQLDSIWYHGSLEGSKMVEEASAENLKRSWVNYGQGRDWFNQETGEGREFLRQSTAVKNIWLPYGD